MQAAGRRPAAGSTPGWPRSSSRTMARAARRAGGQAGRPLTGGLAGKRQRALDRAAAVVAAHNDVLDLEDWSGGRGGGGGRGSAAEAAGAAGASAAAGDSYVAGAGGGCVRLEANALGGSPTAPAAAVLMGVPPLAAHCRSAARSPCRVAARHRVPRYRSCTVPSTPVH